MKHSTPNLMKFKRLQRALGLRKVETAGLLELLWITTQNNAKRGNIGLLSNEEIAIELDWSGDPDELVAALVKHGWLDEHEEYRLVVHDWAEHAPRYVKGIVARKGVGGFVVPAQTSEILADDVRSQRMSTTSVENVRELQPNPTIPNHTQPPPNDETDVNREWEEVEEQLKKFGVTLPSEAVNRARRSGLGIPKANQILDEYRAVPGAYGPGALFRRLTGELENWPPPREEFLRDQEKRQHDEKIKRRREERAQAEREQAAGLAEKKRLEALYGERVDAMEDKEAEELLKSRHPNPQVYNQMLSRSNMRHVELLDILAERDSNSQSTVTRRPLL